MAYYKKILLILFFCFLFLFFSKNEAFCTVFYIDGKSYDTSVFASDLPKNYNIDDFFVADNTNGYYCMFLRKSFTGRVITDIGSGGNRILTSNGSKWQAYLDRNGFYKENVYSSGSNFKGIVFSTRDIYNEDGSIFYTADQPVLPFDIRFPTAPSNLIGIAQGTERTIEIELLNYDVKQMPNTLYLNIYKKVGDNYNIYSIPVYIYNQFPTYVTQAPLNNDLFLFIDKSKLYSMGINFQSSDEFYLFLSDDVAPKGYSSWNNDGTGILLGTTLKTTDATIYDESGFITIPTLTTEQEQDNQNQSDTQKQIDAINKQTEEQKETKDFLRDDNIDDDNINLPSIETNDITEDGIDNIFTAIYNGLTSGEAKDIVLPFPFTNKSITIPANYTEQFLTTSAFSPIYAIIQAFYWYIIARFIIKDIASKFEKIKSGNIENLENNNIKTDML